MFRLWLGPNHCSKLVASIHKGAAAAACFVPPHTGHTVSQNPSTDICTKGQPNIRITPANGGVSHCAASIQLSGTQPGAVLQLPPPPVEMLQHSALQDQHALLAAHPPRQQHASMQRLLPRWHECTLWRVTVSRPRPPQLWQQQQQQPRRMQQSYLYLSLQQLRQMHAPPPKQPSKQQPDTANTADANTVSQEQAAAAAEKLPGSAFTTLPNMLSLSRVAMGPWLAYCIASQQWPVAVALTAAAGATDWLDGYLARRLGHTSKLGSYLDPLCDKVFVATAVGTLGWMGMVPSWLAVLVVGRDSAQVVGMFWYRWRMFGGTWPGASAFFNVDHARSSTPAGSSAASAEGSCFSGDASTVGAPHASKQQEQQQDQLPLIRPLFISKANTALVMALVAGCMVNQWQGVPDQDMLGALEAITAGTTLASAGAYAHLHWKGKLLAAAPSGESRSSV